MKIIPVQTSVFREGDDLLAFILAYIPPLKENSVLVITSKIVALCEKRTAAIGDDHTKEELIRSESQFAMHTKYVWLTIKDNMVMASAGIDESNADGKLILLPKDSFETASTIREKICQKYAIKNLGVLITDSRTMPLRAGITGVALGYAGFQGVKDYRGQSDIFGRPFHFSRVDIADSLAAAAVLVMGEGNEQIPLAVIENPPIIFCDQIDRTELDIDVSDDMYGPLFGNITQGR